MLKCHYSTVWSMKNVAVLTVDRAFALFLRPHLEGFDTQESPPGNLPFKAKKMLMPGGQPGLGAMALGAQVAQAYYESSEQHYPT